MKRRLLDLLTLLSLLLCVGAAVLWARGFGVSEMFGWVFVRPDGGRRAVWLCSGRGGIGFTVASVPPGLVRVSGPDWTQRAPEYGGAKWHEFATGRLGFYFAASLAAAPNTGVRSAGVCLPAPLVVLATALLPALDLRRRRRLRNRAGFCPRCGYDLTGNVSGMCPECGTKL